MFRNVESAPDSAKIQRPVSLEMPSEGMDLNDLVEGTTYIVAEDVQLNGYIGEHGPLELSQVVLIPEGAALTVEKLYPSVAVGDEENDDSGKSWILAVDTPEEAFKVQVYADENFNAHLKVEKD